MEKEPVSPIELEEPAESVFQRRESDELDQEDEAGEISILAIERAKAIGQVAAACRRQSGTGETDGE